ncbi:MAG TPA: exodeoxyribonuclease III [Aestuariivirgaceae bacterium]|jgi:exodeoxyribonuclease-3
MLIATFNINGVKARIDSLVSWLKDASPDVCCLQEIKSPDEAFPKQPLEDLGYNVATHGQKGFNGVAILSKRPFEDIRARLPGDEGDAQSRYLEAVIPVKSGIIRVAAVYLPNGNPPETEKYSYKLAWMERLRLHAGALLKLEEPLVLAGDFNVIPTGDDAKRPEAWVNDALFLPRTRERFRALTHLGLTDAVRITHCGKGPYTFWDYQAGAWRRDDGIRIDFLLLSPQATDRLAATRVDKYVRGLDKASDHVPVLAELKE